MNANEIGFKPSQEMLEALDKWGANKGLSRHQACKAITGMWLEEKGYLQDKKVKK